MDLLRGADRVAFEHRHRDQVDAIVIWVSVMMTGTRVIRIAQYQLDSKRAHVPERQNDRYGTGSQPRGQRRSVEGYDGYVAGDIQSMVA